MTILRWVPGRDDETRLRTAAIGDALQGLEAEGQEP